MSTKTITIAGSQFDVHTPYAEGHTLTAAEARALNQVRCENIRNNCAKVVKNEDGSRDAAAIAKHVSDYDANYDFSVQAAGPRRVVDPLEKECLRLAKDVVKSKLAKAGHTVKVYTKSDDGQAKYNAAVEQVMGMKEIVKIAKANLTQQAEAAKVASADLGV